MAITTIITTLPFLIGHLAVMGGNEHCILDEWLSIDHQAKTTIVAFVTVMMLGVITAFDPKIQETMLLVCGYGMFGFFLFQTLYLIYGVTLFFRAAGNNKILQ